MWSRHFQRQKRRKPCRCQRTTVSGVTKVRHSHQPAKNRRAGIHSTLSRKCNLARGRVRVGRVQHRQVMPQQQALDDEVVPRSASARAASGGRGG